MPTCQVRVVAQAASEHWEKYPELREKLQAAAADPISMKLEVFQRLVGGRGRGRGRGRTKAEERKPAAEAEMRKSASEGLQGPPTKKTSAEDWCWAPRAGLGRGGRERSCLECLA